MLLRIASVAEGLTALALLFAPSFLGVMLFGQELSGLASLTARFAGIALLSLAIACWPASPIFAMFFYNGAATLYLGYVGLAGGTVGILLWPGIVFHFVFAVLLGVSWASSRQRPEGKAPSHTA